MPGQKNDPSGLLLVPRTGQRKVGSFLGHCSAHKPLFDPKAEQQWGFQGLSLFSVPSPSLSWWGQRWAPASEGTTPEARLGQSDDWIRMRGAQSVGYRDKSDTVAQTHWGAHWGHPCERQEGNQYSKRCGGGEARHSQRTFHPDVASPRSEVLVGLACPWDLWDSPDSLYWITHFV